MELIAYLILVFTLLQLLVALLNALIREKPRAGMQDGSEPLVTIMIPARNEEKNIINIIEDLLRQDYMNIEILVFDDQSDDRTYELASALSEHDKRIRVISSRGLPEGWLGKNHACNSMALEAKGEYLLYLDADVRAGKGIIRNILSFAQKKGIDLISIFPKQIISGPGEKSTVPLMNYILLSLLPLIAVRKIRFPSLAAANGQFMFFRGSAYRSVKPHERLKANKVEDIETARLFKKLGHKVACFTGDDTIKCRMYSGFRESVTGFSKNVAAYFGNSLLAATFFWLITTAGFIVIYIAFTTWVFILYLAAFITTRLLVSVASEQKVVTNLIFLIPQQLSFGLIIYTAAINRYFRKFKWKGRQIN
jgi:glycosyltransferase involved in cell wall biosynthesis